MDFVGLLVIKEAEASVAEEHYVKTEQDILVRHSRQK